MVELTEASRAVIRALLEAPLAWQTPGELARALRRDPDETTDLVAALDAGGWLSAWEGEEGEGPAVTLSVAGAARLDVRLVEHGPDQMPRWATRNQPDPATPRAQGVFRGERAASLDLVVDPRSLPDVAMVAAEQAAGSLAARDAADAPGHAARIARLPLPSLLLGTGMTPWPGPSRCRAEGQSCPVCGDRPLAPSMYCLACDRWGLDHRLVEDAPAPPRASVALDLGEIRRRRDAEARARKAKRRLRLAAVEADLKKKRASKRKGTST